MPLRLLVADDDQFIRTLVRTLLAVKEGWQVCGEAANGSEAVEKAREHDPDVVILDLSMPVMNGFEAAVEIRRFASSTKIVFFSAHDFSAKAEQFGANAFVDKLSATQELVTTIERVIGRPRELRRAANSRESKSPGSLPSTPHTACHGNRRKSKDT